MQISSALNDYRLAAVISFLAIGTTNAKVQIYDGTQPAFGGTPSDVPLVEILLVEPCGTVEDGLLTLEPTDEYLITRSGTATWARVINGNGDLAWDCAVTDLNGAGPLKLSQTTLYAGGYTRLVSGALG